MNEPADLYIIKKILKNTGIPTKASKVNLAALQPQIGLLFLLPKGINCTPETGTPFAPSELPARGLLLMADIVCYLGPLISPLGGSGS